MPQLTIPMLDDKVIVGKTLINNIFIYIPTHKSNACLKLEIKNNYSTATNVIKARLNL